MKKGMYIQLLIVLALVFSVGCGSQHRTAQFDKIEAYIAQFEPDLQSGGFTNLTMRAVPSDAGGEVLVEGTVRNQEELDLLKKVIRNPMINADLPSELKMNVKTQK